MAAVPGTRKWRHYLALMRVDRPIGTLLLLWPTYWALWLAAKGPPDLLVFLVFSAGTFLMRSAGCVINDYFDRDFDGHVARTSARPLAAGLVTTREALGLFVILCLVSAALLPFLNALTVALATVALVLAASYPLFKRFTHLPQAYLGLAFSWGIPMAFAAQTGTVPGVAWWLLGANVLWVLAYDTAYAMADRPDDLKIGVKSTAILFGRADRLMIGLFHLGALGILAAIGLAEGLRWLFFVALAVAGALALYEQWLLRDRDRGRAFQAFLHNNWIGVAIFLGIVASLP